EWQKLLDVLVVEAQDRGPVKRDLVDELEESRANLDDGGVVIEMLAVDVGDDGEDGAELEEGAVALIRFDHEEIALTDACVRTADGGGVAADDHGRIETSGAEDCGGHRSCGGLAVAAGHRDSVLQAHQLGQEFAARNDGYLHPARLGHFRIAGVEGGGD